MKKRNVNLLQLNKASISNLLSNEVKGGGWSWTCNSWCECPTERNCTDTKCHTVWDCEL